MVLQTGYVYLIHALGTTRYKLGRSSDVSKRLEILGLQCPFPLKLLASAYVEDCVAEEKRLHKLAKDYHAHGEWFDLPDDWLRDIKPWFYDSRVKTYDSNPGFLLLAPDITQEQRINRVVQLLGCYVKGQVSKKVKNELSGLLGKLPSSPSEAASWKMQLKKKK